MPAIPTRRRARRRMEGLCFSRAAAHRNAARRGCLQGTLRGLSRPGLADLPRSVSTATQTAFTGELVDVGVQTAETGIPCTLQNASGKTTVDAGVQAGETEDSETSPTVQACNEESSVVRELRDLRACLEQVFAQLSAQMAILGQQTAASIQELANDIRDLSHRMDLQEMNSQRKNEQYDWRLRTVEEQLRRLGGNDGQGGSVNAA